MQGSAAHKPFCGLQGIKIKEMIKECGPVRGSNSLPLAEPPFLGRPLIPLSQGAVTENSSRRQCAGSLHLLAGYLK